jgi:hypothetical protein
MEPMDEERIGWVGWGPDGPSRDLPPHVHGELMRRQAEHKAARGQLLARVEVRVFESGDSEAQVSFPPDGVLSPEDTEEIAEVIRIARASLADWR